MSIKQVCFTIIVSIFIALFSASCVKQYSSYDTRVRFATEVDSYGDDGLIKDKLYFLMPRDTTISKYDLQYSEFSNYIRKSLGFLGYTEVSKLEDAKVLILFGYGIGDPITYEFNYPLANYGKTGTLSTTTKGSVYNNSYSNSVDYNQTTTSIPSYGVTGYTNIPISRTKYLRHMNLTAIDIDFYKKNNEMKVFWKTNITSSGSSGDLRRVMPYLVVAGHNYFGRNSITKKEIEIFEEDKRINELRGISAKR